MPKPATIVKFLYIVLQIDNGVFEISFYAMFVRQSMAQLCAPARDDEVNALKEIHEAVPLFR